ncbi:MAG: ATP-binding cassette domain-containing protein [Lachnospiraceae bacterium]|nr:ATP-binding cassette domain-containing protein [Lachnospiraceae bacterium]
MLILKVEGLTKKFGRCLANNNICLQMNQGDIYGLVGKNGAGKTTLMRQIAGYMKSTSGSIEWFEIEGCIPKLGVAIETDCFNRSLNAVSLLKLYGNSIEQIDSQEIDNILKQVGLYQDRFKKIGKYSTGMKQKLSIALALICSPDFLILDEPMNGLDPASVKEIRELLISINQEKKVTMMISSHILSELTKIVTVYGVIANGCLIKQLSSDELNEMDEEQRELYFLHLMEGET